MQALHVTGRLERPGQITIVDRGEALLGQFSPKAHDYAVRKLTEAGADVKLEVGVTAVHADRVEFDDGSTIQARTVVWGGGESGSAIAQTAGPAPGRGGRLDVRLDLGIDGFPGVYAVGDVANIPSDEQGGAPLPQLGSVALQSGRGRLRTSCASLAASRPSRSGTRTRALWQIIGRNAAVPEVGKHRHQVEGPIAFAAWLGRPRHVLSGAHSKTDAFLSWAWDYFDRDHAATVEASSTPQRLAWSEDDEDVPHISLDRPKPSGTDPATRLRRAPWPTSTT